MARFLSVVFLPLLQGVVALRILNCSINGGGEFHWPSPSFRFAYPAPFKLTGAVIDLSDEDTAACTMPATSMAGRIARVKWDDSRCDLERWAAECQRVGCLAILYEPTSERFFSGATACCWHTISGHRNMDLTPILELDAGGAALLDQRLRACPDLQVQVADGDENISLIWLDWLFVPWCVVSLHGIVNAAWAISRTIAWNRAKSETTPKALTYAVHLNMCTSCIAIVPGLAFADGMRRISVGIVLMMFRLALDLMFASMVAMSIMFGRIMNSLGMLAAARRRQVCYHTFLVVTAVVLSIYDLVTGVTSFLAPRWTPKNSISAAVFIELCILLPICIFFLRKGKKICRDILEPKVVSFLSIDERQRRLRFVQRTLLISVCAIAMIFCIAGFGLVNDVGHQWILLVSSWFMFMMSESALLRAIQMPASSAPMKMATHPRSFKIKTKPKLLSSFRSSLWLPNETSVAGQQGAVLAGTFTTRSGKTPVNS